MSQSESLRESLCARLEKLESRQQRVEQDLRRLSDPDSQERAQERENDEVLEDLEEQGRREIEQLQRAIARIDAGTYGICEACGNPIPEARLEALPDATRCVPCAS